MIDYGEYFDFAAQSLALNLKVPIISGGTFAATMTVDSIKQEGEPCLLCLNED